MIFPTVRAAIFAACLFATANAQSTKPSPIPTPTGRPENMGQRVAKGCFKSSTPLQDYGPGQYQTPDTCQQICVGIGKAVFGISAGSNCWCGDLIPDANDEVDKSECSSICNGFGESGECGGIGRFSVFLSGLDNNSQDIGNYKPQASSTAAPTSTGGNTSQPPPTAGVTQPAPPSQTSPPAEEKKGANVGAIVGGVVAVVVVAFLAVGAWFFMKRRKDQRAEQSRRSAAMRDFYGKPPGTGVSSIADNRLDPGMMQRRSSNGSIADNEDYSRRVLAVTNA